MNNTHRKIPCHNFSVDDAIKYGCPEAALLNHIRTMIEVRKIEPEHYKDSYHDGKFWYSVSKVGLTNFFPYWTERQIRTLLTNLLSAGAISAGNFNKDKRDKTLWYSLNVE